MNVHKYPKLNLNYVAGIESVEPGHIFPPSFIFSFCDIPTLPAVFKLGPQVILLSTSSDRASTRSLRSLHSGVISTFLRP